jgi:hypothetical protein
LKFCSEKEQKERLIKEAVDKERKESEQFKSQAAVSSSFVCFGFSGESLFSFQFIAERLESNTDCQT